MCGLRCAFLREKLTAFLLLILVCWTRWILKDDRCCSPRAALASFLLPLTPTQHSRHRHAHWWVPFRADDLGLLSQSTVFSIARRPAESRKVASFVSPCARLGAAGQLTGLHPGTHPRGCDSVQCSGKRTAPLTVSVSDCGRRTTCSPVASSGMRGGDWRLCCCDNRRSATGGKTGSAAVCSSSPSSLRLASHPATSPSPAVLVYPFKEIEEKWARYYSDNPGDFSPPLPSRAEEAQPSPAPQAEPVRAETCPVSCVLPTDQRGGPSPSDKDLAFRAEDKRKFYILSMIPYPSGAGLHVGHSLTYTAADVVARYQRLRLRGELLRAKQRREEPTETFAEETDTGTPGRGGVTPPAKATGSCTPSAGSQSDDAAAEGSRSSVGRSGGLRDGSSSTRRAQRFPQTSVPPAGGERKDESTVAEEAVASGQTSADGVQVQETAPEPQSGETGGPALQPDVLHVMGWDSFGLPAEQHAVASGISPRVSVKNNIDRFRKQLQRLGICADWRREVNTSSPSFYKWTQWIFVQMMKRGLVYEKIANVNWCEALGTVLANEEVVDGFSERGGFPVSSRKLAQWHLRITAYAEKLLAGLKKLDWPSDVKRMQRNWIGRRDVLELDLPVFAAPDTRESSRALRGQAPILDSIPAVGATSRVATESLRCVALSPELICGSAFVLIHSCHPDARSLARTAAARDYVEEASVRAAVSDQEKGEGSSEGHFSGSAVQHPLFPSRRLPVWLSDRLFTQLQGFGNFFNETDALLVSPDGDFRARGFAEAAGIDIIRILEVPGPTGGNAPSQSEPNEMETAAAEATASAGSNQTAVRSVSMATSDPNGGGGEQTACKDTLTSGPAQRSEPDCQKDDNDTRLVVPKSPETEETRLMNSEVEGLSLNGKSLACARQEVLRFFTGGRMRGYHKVRYAMRDWLFSRQRCWGEPMPLVRSTKNDGPQSVFPVDEADLPVLLPDELPLKGQRAESKAEPRERTHSSNAGANETRNSLRNQPTSPVPAAEDEGTPAATLAPLYALPQWWNATLALREVGGMQMASTLRNAGEDKPGLTKHSESDLEVDPLPARACQRETSTMPQWAGSSWYFLRFLDPQNTREPFARRLANFWMPVDMYIGGKEHAVTHLLYARFWHKVLHDLGLVDSDEPFRRLVTPGIILGTPQYFVFKRQDTGDAVSSETVDLIETNTAREKRYRGGVQVPGSSRIGVGSAFQSPPHAQDSLTEKAVGIHRPSGQHVYAAEVPASRVAVTPTGVAVLRDNTDVKLCRRHEKMSKSRGNVVSPDDIIDVHGADALRLYLLFMGPLESRKIWNTSGVVGAARFLNRVWHLFVLPGGEGSFEKEGPLRAPCATPATAGSVMGEYHTGTPKKLKLLNAAPSAFERTLLTPLIRRVTTDIERMSMNTAIAALMAAVRKLAVWTASGNTVSVRAAIDLIRLLHPFAPFITEELWHMICATFPDACATPSRSSLLASAIWPVIGREAGHISSRSDGAVEDETGTKSVVFSVHVDGKLQGTVHVPPTAADDEEKVTALARRFLSVTGWGARKPEAGRFARIVFIPSRHIINFVT
ncbi:leucyl-tRNA synthetase (LeuRS2) [Besnoitia besnoiti]|uniref:leucine--tRNA ligase n=1 Tax=Besnoitia besnoiti TaxID=94643 RepID=A0A2A9ME28_BESBE|nr:leucyl-tRNA synthetase (LeuRS2) [Besnoitia besnoiti]PFH36768.1 leucyl-tRNA synthetase (LeuRS2) [Besnoitia besnoiti]